MWHRALDRVQMGGVPVVAALHGAVVGGGLELAAACHIRVAEASTFYALPEGQRGIFVGRGAAVRLPKLIGVARMADMMLTGRMYSAEEGVNIGLSQYLVKSGEGLAKALELANKIAQNAPMTNFAITQVLPRIAEVGQDQGLMMEALTAAIAQSSQAHLPFRPVRFGPVAMQKTERADDYRPGHDRIWPIGHVCELAGRVFRFVGMQRILFNPSCPALTI